MRNLMTKLFGDAAEPGASEEDLHRAALALLYEVARADGHVDESERARLLEALGARWGLPESDPQQVLAEIRDHAEDATDFFDHTRLLRENWGPEPRARLVADMWDVAHADGHADPEEESVIRRVADLLYVSHGDFIRGKMQADDRD